MRDLLGSSIRPGSLLWWLSKSIPIRVARIDEPSKLAVVGRNQPQEKVKLVLEVTIPLDALTQGVETHLTDFLCVVNPDAERALSDILEGQKMQ